MAKSPNERQATDKGRVGRAGAGKLDRRRSRAKPQPSRDDAARDDAPHDDAARIASARKRIESERQAAIDQLRTMRVSPDVNDSEPRAGTDVVLDEGDAAQASERQDMNFVVRQRLAERINRLTAALERIQQGRYGTCSLCGRAIEPGRLAAAPDADVCLECQQRRERGTEPDAAA